MTIEARIREDIEQRIHSGEWRPGDRVPFEHELVQVYGCSRATVGKALVALARAGLIERRRKAGSFVAHPQVHSAVLEVPDLADLVERRGEAYAWELMTQRSVRPSDANPLGEPAVLVEGRHCAGGEPLALERRLIALAAVPNALVTDFTAEAPGGWLLHHIPWTSARHRIRAVEATSVEARLLQVRPRAACLELDRRTWRTGKAVTQVRQLFRADRFDLTAEFKPGGDLPKSDPAGIDQIRPSAP